MIRAMSCTCCTDEESAEELSLWTNLAAIVMGLIVADLYRPHWRKNARDASATD